jgi:Zn-dependent protease with chaperone function
MDYKVNGKENVYFAIKVIFTVIVWLALIGIGASLGEEGALAGATIGVIIVYALCIALFLFFQKIFIVAFMKGDGICVSEAQFPDVYRKYTEMAAKLGLKKVPPLFVIQQGGALNAFAIRFSCKNYIAIYSDVFAVHESDPDALEFVLGHELGHVRRHHMSKAFWTIPANLIPFLGAAWSRACEYTCDNIGAFLTGSAKTNGLLLLAGGGDLYGKINVPQYLDTARFHRTSVVRFVGLFMSHPWLPARIESLNAQYR